MPITIPIIEGEVYCDGLICVSPYKNMGQRESCENRNTGYRCLSKLRDVYRDKIVTEPRPGIQVSMRRRIRAVNSEGVFLVMMNFIIIRTKGDPDLFSGSISECMERVCTLDEAIEMVDIMTAKTEARAIKHY